MARQRVASVVKLINGSGKRNKEQVRDDSKVGARGPYIAPEYHALSDEAKIVYKWWVKHADRFWVGDYDGAALCVMAESIAQRNAAQKKVAQYGMVIKDPRTSRPILSPYFKAVANLDERIRRLMNELGLTPVSRLKFAPPLADRNAKDAGDWSDVA